MTNGAFRVAMTGANTLLGRELLSVLKERTFPLSHVTTLDEDFSEDDAPILDLSSEPVPVIGKSEDEGAGYDFLFCAQGPRSARRKNGKPTAADQAQNGGLESLSRFVIHVSGTPSAESEAAWCAPWLGKAGASAPAKARAGARIFASPHAAALALTAVFLPLATEPGVQHASVVIFSPASELGSAAIDELQKQTLSLLNFSEAPQEFFGGQAAFNLLPRLKGKASARAPRTASRLREEIEHLIDGRVPTPALRVLHAPVFYSTAFSAHVQPERRASALRIEQTLAQDRVQWVSASQPPPSPVEVQGTRDLFLDPVAVDEDGGFWVWGRFDDLRIAAENAVETAEQLISFLDRA